jgi:hypothetical protein
MENLELHTQYLVAFRLCGIHQKSSVARYPEDFIKKLWGKPPTSIGGIKSGGVESPSDSPMFSVAERVHFQLNLLLNQLYYHMIHFVYSYLVA